MRIKRLAALSLAAVLTAGMLTGCPWDIEDDASSVTSSSSSSSSTSRPSYDDEDNGPVMYTVTVEYGEGGTATASPSSVAAGGSVTITVKPDEGYEVDSVTANGAALSSNPGDPYTYTIANIQADQQIMVSFEFEGLVTAEDRAKIREALTKMAQSEELKAYNIQQLTFSREDEKFLEEWFQDAGYKYTTEEDFKNYGKVVEDKFGFQVFDISSTSAQNACLKNENVWLTDDTTILYTSTWIEDIEVELLSTKSTFKNLLERAGYIDATYSMGFFTAEDTKNQQIHIVAILKCVAKSSAAAPVA